jgi:hypothetical protein
MAKPKSDQSSGMRKEYDFSGGERGKYAERYAQGSNVVVLAPDVARLYRDAEAVNRALRAIAEVAPTPARKGNLSFSPRIGRLKTLARASAKSTKRPRSGKTRANDALQRAPASRRR